MERKTNVSSSGVSLLGATGVAIAVQIFWGINHHIGWALWHGILNWIYVLYRLAINQY